ncbi:hypothetical protein ACTFIR_005714 [Dictyostelium discoideum]
MTGTSARFIFGEDITIEDALYGMMHISGNDAANTLAYHGGGDIELFMKNLNRFLSKVGCKQTNFNNPHGLHHPDHISSAHGLAFITLYGSILFRSLERLFSQQNIRKIGQISRMQ